MPTNRLTQRRIDTLKPRRKTCDIRDSEIKGFGVRILPSGRKRYFLHSQIAGNRNWHAIGDSEDITLESARTQARALLVSMRNGDEAASETSQPIAFELVAEEVFQRYRDTGSRAHWRSISATTKNRSCPGSGAGRLPTSHAWTFSSGSPRSMQRRWPRTGQRRSSR